MLQGLPPQERQQVFQTLPPEQQQVLQALPPEQILAALSPEQIRQYLDRLDGGQPGSARKPRRKK